MPIRVSFVRPFAPYLLAATAAAWLPALAVAAPEPVLYVESNITEPGQNSIIAFGRAEDGSLTPLPGSPFATYGTGFFDASFKLGPFDIDQSLVADPAHDALYAVNGGSNTISGFHINHNGTLDPLPAFLSASHGRSPVALGVHDDTLVTVNSDEDPAQAGAGGLPNYTVQAIGHGGQLFHVRDSSITLAAGSAPSQPLTTNTGPFVFTDEFLGGTLRSFVQVPHGRLYPLDAVKPPMEAGGVQPLPLGLWANPKAPILYVGFPNTSELGVYRWTDEGRLEFRRTATNSGKAICWLRTNKQGDRLYTLDSGTDSVSVYDTSTPDRPVEIQAVSAGGAGGLFALSLDPAGRFLYALEQNFTPASLGKSNKIFVFKIEPVTGTLTLLAHETVTLDLPANTRPIGLVVF